MDRKRDDVAKDVITSLLTLGLNSADKLTMQMKLATVLRQLLDQKKITLKELATATKIKPSTLSGWKNGVTPRDLEEVMRCAQYFQVSLEKLLFDRPTEVSALEGLLTENVFEGYLKVKIERVIKTKIKGEP